MATLQNVLQLLTGDRFIRREQWRKCTSVRCADAGRLLVSGSNGIETDWTPSRADLEARDWGAWQAHSQ